MPLPMGYVSPITDHERRRVRVLLELDPEALTLDEHSIALILGIEDDFRSGVIYHDAFGHEILSPIEVVLAMAHGETLDRHTLAN